MKPLLLLVATLALAGGSVSAEEGGCLKYGAGGAVTGHFVGRGHSLSGAAVGCGVARTNATRLGKRKRALVTRKRTRISGKTYLFSEPLPSRSDYHPFVFYCGQSGSDLGGGSRLGFGQRIEGAWPSSICRGAVELFHPTARQSPQRQTRLL